MIDNILMVLFQHPNTISNKNSDGTYISIPESKSWNTLFFFLHFIPWIQR
jgi:hypothetical protein